MHRANNWYTVGIRNLGEMIPNDKKNNSYFYNYDVPNVVMKYFCRSMVFALSFRGAHIMGAKDGICGGQWQRPKSIPSTST